MQEINVLQNVIQKQCELLLHPTNPYFEIPQKYTIIMEFIISKRADKYLLLSAKEIANECNFNLDSSIITCFSYLQDIGILLFNKNTNMICTDPQILGKAMACFLIPPEQFHSVFKNSPNPQQRSLLTKVSEVYGLNWVARNNRNFCTIS